MNFFEEATLRLKQQLRATQDKEAALALGLSPRAWAGRKQSGSFPEKELRALAQQRPELGIDVDYVLTGAGRDGVTSAVAMGWAADKPSRENVAQRLAGDGGGLRGGHSAPQAVTRPLAPAPSDEALLLAAFRAADAPGRAAVLLAAQGIAALAKAKTA